MGCCDVRLSVRRALQALSSGSASWGGIGGTLSSQTDLQSALDAKANTSSLSTVATSGAYADLSGRPTVIKANANTSPVTANAADTYLTGSNLTIGGFIKAGTVIEWTFVMTKTNAGVAAPVYSVRFGTNGSTSDTARLTFTGPAQTAATDTGVHRIRVIIRSVSSTGTVNGLCTMEHHNTTTGLQNVAQIRVFQSTSAAFDNSGSSLQVGVSCNPGASGVWTFEQVSTQMFNLV
jgi:hypothetical protein